jgi:hypothetical protein
MALVFFESASELATLTNTFTVDDVATDPTTITLVITDPEGTETTYTFADAEITRTSAGVYTKDIVCDKAGEWTFRWQGTGDATDTEVGTWTVFDVTLGRLYATVAALKSRLGGGIDHDRDDYELHTACFAASRMVEHYCQRFFYRTTSEARTFAPHNPYLLKLPEFNDLVSVTTFKTDTSGNGTFDVTWASTDYQLLPVNPSAGAEQKPYTKVKALARMFPLPFGPLSRDDRVEITGVFGWPALPYSVKQSALITAAELFKSKSTFEAQMGYEEMAQLIVRRNPMALDLVKPYRRHAVLVA